MASFLRITLLLFSTLLYSFNAVAENKTITDKSITDENKAAEKKAISDDNTAAENKTIYHDIAILLREIKETKSQLSDRNHEELDSLFDSVITSAEIASSEKLLLTDFIHEIALFEETVLLFSELGTIIMEAPLENLLEDIRDFKQKHMLLF